MLKFIGIGLSSTYNSVRNASCTSCEISVDKSNYWTPQLYYEHSNGSFEKVPNDGMVVYYLGRGDNRTNIQPFPPGFQMLSGNARARAYDNTTMTFGALRVSRMSMGPSIIPRSPKEPGSMAPSPLDLSILADLSRIEFPSIA